MCDSPINDTYWTYWFIVKTKGIRKEILKVLTLNNWMCHLHNSKTEKRAIGDKLNILGKWHVIYFIYD